MKHNFRQNMIAKGSIVSNGIITNNPIFRLVIGTCPTLAITISAVNSLGMGLATTFVLICSNALVSLLRKVIPDKVRIPAYVLIIATFVTVVEMIMRKFLPSLFDALGIYLPLIVVNCIIFARAESFASSNSVFDSVLDGVGMGLGFTIAILIMSIIREFLGAGSFFYGSLAGIAMGLKFDGLSEYAMNFFVMPAGGFLVFGFIMAAVNAITDRAQKKKNKQKELMKNKVNAEIVTAHEEAAL
ncbi:MAG TPA: electron transport complex subunit E [Clostridia bacterium]|nr:electron transport complex subunit E [Clostridia bacterium]